MNKMFGISMLIIFILTQNVFSQETKNMKAFQEVKSPTGVILKVELLKENYLILEPIELAVTITNESSKNIILNLTDELSPSKIKIINLKTQEEVSPSLYGKKLQN